MEGAGLQAQDSEAGRAEKAYVLELSKKRKR